MRGASVAVQAEAPARSAAVPGLTGIAEIVRKHVAAMGHLVEAEALAARMLMHVPADKLGLVARAPEFARQCGRRIPLALFHVAEHAVGGGKLSGHEAAARRNAHGAGRVGVLEAHAFGGQRIEIGRLHLGMPLDAQRVAAELIAHDHEKVGAWHVVLRGPGRINCDGRK